MPFGFFSFCLRFLFVRRHLYNINPCAKLQIMPKFPKYRIICPFQYVKFSEPTHNIKHNSLINCPLMQQSTQTHHTHISPTPTFKQKTATAHHQTNTKQHPVTTNAKTPRRLKCNSSVIVHPLFSQQANPHRTHTEPTLDPHSTSRQRKTETLPPPMPTKSLRPFYSICPNTRFQSSALPLPSLFTM